MNRTEVKGRLDQVRGAIKEIEDNEEPVAYATANKYLPEVGYIAELDTIEEIVNAHVVLSKLSKNDTSESVKALGLTESEIPENNTRIIGFKSETWFKDLDTRLNVVHTETKLARLKAAELTLKGHMSADDKFEMDTAGIDALLA